MQRLVSDFVDTLGLQQERQQMMWEDDRSRLIEQADRQYLRMRRHAEMLGQRYDRLVKQIEVIKSSTTISSSSAKQVAKKYHESDLEEAQDNQVPYIKSEFTKAAQPINTSTGQKRKEITAVPDPTTIRSQKPPRATQPSHRPNVSDEPYRAPYIETVRNRAEREALPGHMCGECNRYYEALAQQGMLFDEAARREMLVGR